MAEPSRALTVQPVLKSIPSNHMVSLNHLSGIWYLLMANSSTFRQSTHIHKIGKSLKKTKQNKKITLNILALFVKILPLMSHFQAEVLDFSYKVILEYEYYYDSYYYCYYYNYCYYSEVARYKMNLGKLPAFIEFS